MPHINYDGLRDAYAQWIRQNATDSQIIAIRDQRDRLIEENAELIVAAEWVLETFFEDGGTNPRQARALRFLQEAVEKAEAEDRGE